MSERPVLARLEIPDQTLLLLLYENMVIKGPDRSGNWRFMFDRNGCFFQARNTQLWLMDEAQFFDDAPALYWDTPFPTIPDRCLTEMQEAELRDAILKVDFPDLDEYYASSSIERISTPIVERWTVVHEDELYSVVVEQGAAPSELVELRTRIDQLVATALGPTSP